MSIGQKPNKFRRLLLFGIAMTENDITNSIWRKWQEQKITPPMTWQQLWDKVREYIKAGKDPYDILRGPAPSEEWMEKKGFAEIITIFGVRLGTKEDIEAFKEVYASSIKLYDDFSRKCTETREPKYCRATQIMGPFIHTLEKTIDKLREKGLV